MRAQFVRGQDPKDAMDIGNKYVRIQNQLLDSIDKLVKEYGLDPNTVRMTEDSKLNKQMLAYEFNGKKRPGYYGGKRFKNNFYIFYWFLIDTFLPGVVDNQAEIADQGEEKTLSGAINFLKKALDKNESAVY